MFKCAATFLIDRKYLYTIIAKCTVNKTRAQHYTIIIIIIGTRTIPTFIDKLYMSATVQTNIGFFELYNICVKQ